MKINFKKNKQENDNKIKDLKDKVDEINELTFKKFDEIAKEINKVKNDIINKKIEGLKIKNDKSHNEILDNLKEQIIGFIESNNKEVDEIKNNHKKDIDIINNKIKKELDNLINVYDNKIDDNLKIFKNNFVKIQEDFKNQNEINLNNKKSIDDIKNKIDNNKYNSKYK